MIAINEQLLREGIELGVKHCRDVIFRNKELIISDLDLTTVSSYLAGFVEGYCEINKDEEEQTK